MSDSANDLFGPAPLPTATPVPAPAPPPLVWHLPTNQLNLMYMLAAGLVTGPKGFGRKQRCPPRIRGRPVTWASVRSDRALERLA